MSPPLPQIQSLIEKHHTFIVFSHVRPDGDAYGSALGLALALEEIGKTTQVYFQDGLHQSYQFLPGSRKILIPSPLQPPDTDAAIIAVDTSTLPRLGDTFQTWGRKVDLNIDHHISNTQFAEINLISPHAAATSEIIYELLHPLSLPLTEPVATNLYVGIMTDTGSFRYRQTSPRTLSAAAALTAAGANPSFLATQCFLNHPLTRFKLQQEIFSQARYYFDNQVVVCHITPELLTRHGARPEDTENILEPLQAIRDIEIAILIETIDTNTQRASLRSRGKIDVSLVAASLGGGGHPEAAGLRVNMTFNNLTTSLLTTLSPYFTTKINPPHTSNHHLK
ncbi:MAG: bifunctional oligoribonuclease/PAP phosphatase NrnA [Methylacidiphilales bacterium]|nr:bifunctional oligoribonuclease/PAP phosphatase NrnA [Candidatus Methylacidiphilales bacterium]MDW8348719.1 bifunctional oligoribonuclease/PAP phosphatase NrnA [Verrucomicrobiae bacterium]